MCELERPLRTGCLFAEPRELRRLSEAVLWQMQTSQCASGLVSRRALTGSDSRTCIGLQAHGAHDLHTVDWCGLRDFMIATGGQTYSFLSLITQDPKATSWSLGPDAEQQQAAWTHWLSARLEMPFRERDSRPPAVHPMVEQQRCPVPVAGAADGTIKVWDARQLGGANPPALHTFSMHTEAVMRVEWCPHRAGGLVRMLQKIDNCCILMCTPASWHWQAE